MTEFLGYRYIKVEFKMELDDIRFQIATILIVLAAPAYADKPCVLPGTATSLQVIAQRQANGLTRTV